MIRVARMGAVVGVALLVGAWGLPGVGAAPAPAPVDAPAEAPVLAAAAPAITLTPSTGLVSGTSVAVHGTGFPPGETGIVQCRAGLTNINDCDLSNVGYVTTAADGTFDGALNVRRTIRIGSGTLRCADAPDTCVIAAGNLADQTQGAAQAISFDPNAPGPSTSVSADPDTELVDGQSVTVTGSGFAGRPVFLTQCSTGAGGCSARTPITVTPGGGFVTQFIVANRVSGPGGTMSCLEVECTLDVQDLFDPDYDASTALHFDPSGPPPVVPTLTVTPSDDLSDRQEVVLEGSGFDRNALVVVTQCSVPANEGCMDTVNGITVTEADGTFTLVRRARRIVARFGVTGFEQIDCALTPCELSAFQLENGLRAAAPLTFDPDVPPAPPPTVTASPTTDLGYRQTVTVRGTGFTPGSFVNISHCATEENFGFCGPGASAVVDESGNLDASLVVRRFVASPLATPIDCAGTARCELQVDSDDLFEGVTFPLTFDPNAPAPPPPALTVDPSTGLGYRQPVTVHASGLAPDDQVYLQQCLPGTEPFFGPCSGFTSARTDASGNVDTAFTVRRTLSNGFENPTDCAAAPGTCVVTISSSDGGDHAEAPLAFDPSAPIPPPPTLTVTPATKLTDGQNVALAGTGYTPNASIGYTLCTTGTLSLNSCDIEHAGFAVAGVDGSFTGELVVDSLISTANGPIDCGVAPGTCEFAAANLSDYIENGRTPASFGPEIGIESVAVSERFRSARFGVVKVALSAPSTREVRVHYATADGSATAPSDYLAGNGDLAFAPGETSKLIWLGIIADGTRDASEQFFVDLSAPQGASLGEPSRAPVDVARDRSKHDGRHHHHDGHHHGHHHHRHHRGHDHHDHHHRDHDHHGHRNRR